MSARQIFFVLGVGLVTLNSAILVTKDINNIFGLIAIACGAALVLGNRQSSQEPTP